MFRDKLILARKLLIDSLGGHIISESLHPIRPVLRVEFDNNFVLYVRYNHVDEYSYHVQLGSKELERVRFDNMDDEWDVETNPHHFHPIGFDDTVLESDMKGEVETDIPKLISYISEELL